jgi:hypothetical protein
MLTPQPNRAGLQRLEQACSELPTKSTTSRKQECSPWAPNLAHCRVVRFLLDSCRAERATVFDLRLQLGTFAKRPRDKWLDLIFLRGTLATNANVRSPYQISCGACQANNRSSSSNFWRVRICEPFPSVLAYPIPRGFNAIGYINFSVSLDVSPRSSRDVTLIG